MPIFTKTNHGLIRAVALAGCLLLPQCAGPAGVAPRDPRDNVDDPTSPGQGQGTWHGKGCILTQSLIDGYEEVQFDHSCQSVRLASDIRIPKDRKLTLRGGESPLEIEGDGHALEIEGISEWIHVELQGLRALTLGTEDGPAQAADWADVVIDKGGETLPEIRLLGPLGDGCRAGKPEEAAPYRFSGLVIAAALDGSIEVRNVPLAPEDVVLAFAQSASGAAESGAKANVQWTGFCVPEGSTWRLHPNVTHAFSDATVRGHLLIPPGADLVFSPGAILDVVGGTVLTAPAEVRDGDEVRRATIRGALDEPGSWGGIRVRGDGSVQLNGTDVKGGGITLEDGDAHLRDVVLSHAPSCSTSPCQPGRQDPVILVGGGGTLVVDHVTLDSPPADGIQVDTAPADGEEPGQVTVVGDLKAPGIKPDSEDVFTPNPSAGAFWYRRIVPITAETQLSERQREGLERTFGTFDTGCKAYESGSLSYRETFEFGGEKEATRTGSGVVLHWLMPRLWVKQRVVFYRDGDCEDPYKETEYRGFFVRYLEVPTGTRPGPPEAYNLNDWLDVRFHEAYWTLYDERQIQEFNGIAQCDHDDWEAGKPKPVAWRPCYKVTPITDNPFADFKQNDETLKPHKDHTLIGFEDEEKTLYLGPTMDKRAEGHERTRPTELDKSVPYYRQ